jgi:mevalonate kinase
MGRTVAVSTPGKLILMGEHAVVYGRPALIAAIDLRLTARFALGDAAGVHLDLPGLQHTETLPWADLRAYARAVRERWEDYSLQPAAAGFQAVRGEDPAHVVKVALGEVAELLDLRSDRSVGSDRSVRSVRSPESRSSANLHLRVDSQLPIGSGFGSSAATATAVIAGCLAFFGRPAEPGQVERLALEVERRQHGLPSGVDGATILHGGVLWARKLPEGGLEIEKIAARSPLLGHLRVYDTGTPADSTGAVVAAVRERRDRDPAGIEGVLDRMEAAARAFRAGLEKPAEDPDRTLHLIRENEACLEALGVVPEEARAVVRRVEAEGGAAKISGAGSLRGPGAGSLLVYHPQPERIAGWSFLRPFPFYPVHLGASGFREEDSG